MKKTFLNCVKADEYPFLISKANASGNAGLLADDDSAPMIVCQGSGLSFIKCYLRIPR